MHFKIPSDTVMTPEILAKYIGKHKKIVAARNQKLQDAYENRYEIYKAPKKADWKPDNRVSTNFAKYITDTFNGFFCGIPIKTESDDDSVNSYIQMLCAYNNEDSENAELAKISSIHGSAHEIYYLDEFGEECMTHLSPMESFFLVDDTILHRPLYFIRYYLDANNVERGSYSDSRIVRHFRNNGSYVWEDEEKRHGFDGVPATEFKENEEQIGIFESELPAINAHNKALSEKADDVDYFADAYLKILGPRVEDNDLAHIRRNRIINFDGDMSGALPDVDFLQKPNADSTQEHLIDRLETLIFQMSMVPNINAESFGNSSGIALRYKMASMKNLFRTKERKFVSGLNNRYKLLFSNSVALSSGIHVDDWTKIKYQFTPNYPANVSDEADTAAKLEGIVSKETQLSTLSIVDDPKQEIQKMRDEETESMASAAETMRSDDEDNVYKISSILEKRSKGQLTYNNAVRMLTRLGLDEDAAKQMLDDKDVTA
ncbi:MAG: phage portal protein [Bilifractor sp.]|jgi:SPP1 family phage portal protein